MIRSRAYRFFSLFFDERQNIGVALVVLLVLAKVQVEYMGGLLAQAAGKACAMDALMWTIGPNGNGVVVLAIVVCLMLSRVPYKEDPYSFVLAHGSPAKYLAAGIMEAAALAFVTSVVCFAVWSAVAASAYSVWFNWESESSYCFASTGVLFDVGPMLASCAMFLCLFLCALYLALVFRLLEWLTESPVFATVVVAGIGVVCAALPSVNALLFVLPDLTALLQGQCRLTWLFPAAACLTLCAVCVARCNRKDFLSR